MDNDYYVFIGTMKFLMPPDIIMGKLVHGRSPNFL